MAREKPGNAAEDRLRERFARDREAYNLAVRDTYDGDWETPTSPVIIAVKRSQRPATEGFAQFPIVRQFPKPWRKWLVLLLLFTGGGLTQLDGHSIAEFVRGLLGTSPHGHESQQQ